MTPRPIEQIIDVRKAFSNWPAIAVAGAAYKRRDLRHRTIQLKSRGGARIAAPLRLDAGSLYTALEVFAFRAYGELPDLGPDAYVVDIGANLGAFSLWAGERRPGLRGLAFEPDPEAFRFLRTNLERNDLSGIDARPVAVAAKAGTAVLHRGNAGDGVSSLHGKPDSSTDGDSVTVETVAFDEVVASAPGPIGILKLDCEGTEHEIVAESDDASWERIERVWLEFHPVEGRRVADLEARLTALGFVLIDREDFAPELGMMRFERR